MPYREGKKLEDVIPPDRRRQRAIMMVIGGMIGGAVLLEGAHLLMSDPPADTKEPQPSSISTGRLTSEEISAVISRNGAGVRNRCFTPRSELTKAKVDLDIVVDNGGAVTSAHYEGTDARLTECVYLEVKTWVFPAHQDGGAARIPFVFERT